MNQSIDERIGNINISVKSTFLPAESSTPDGPFRYKYDITITNHLPHPVQLLKRHWKIEHVLLGNAEVEGDGVIGLTPKIESKQSFDYSSFTELYMPYGQMSGHYLFKDLLKGDEFSVEIPSFFLTYPILLN